MEIAGKDGKMLLHCMENRSRKGYTTFGSVWKKGEIKKGEFLLNNEKGERIPLQTRINAWWPDGSIKWAAHTASAEKMGEYVEIIPVGKAAVAGEESIPEDYSDETEEMIRIEEIKNGWQVDTGKIRLRVPFASDLNVNKTETKTFGAAGCLAEEICNDNIRRINKIFPVLLLEEKEQGKSAYVQQSRVNEYQVIIHSVQLEEEGRLSCVFRYEGAFQNGESMEKMPFVIRMYLWADSDEIRFVHTFFFDGEEKTDYLKGMGIRFDTILDGMSYQRHIQFATDRNDFHEAAVLLNCEHPRLPQDYLRNQLSGDMDIYEEDANAREAAENLPVWNRYLICQDSPSHYAIRKQTKPECCELTCMHGYRTPGIMAVCGKTGGILLGNKDFWQKYPAGLEVDGLNEAVAACTAWFYSPQADSFDFRHYDTKSYPLSSYEGFEEVGASAVGIAVTSECKIKLIKRVPDSETLYAFSQEVQKPPVYVGTPEYYHQVKAFGYWSLPERETEMESWLEEELDKAVSFYKQEVENRSWYGLFDYGDFMHTYDPVRHTWRYDMGGFAWQNTELVPTLWLWLYFIRTGREDVFTLAEAMSRHCAEVDFYHFGDKKGIGSRHNVRHWGCSCKEPRVAMAGHHRFYYYLTGDLRMGDALEDVKDADKSMPNLIHYHKKMEDGSYSEEYTIRSGPDWVTFVSNWMTQYERTLDPYYLNKIRQGLSDLKETPFGLASGPHYGYDTQTGKLTYLGEEEDTGMHLQICMGGIETWMELADMLEDEKLKDMLADYGRFYMLSPEEKAQETNGAIYKRSFSFPFFASALAAYSVRRRKDEELADLTVKHLLYALANDTDTSGFTSTVYEECADGRKLSEIPWIKTNFTAQWCLNTIVALEFLREYLPDDVEKMKMLLKRINSDQHHRA